jgi:hypothetical protein
MLKNPLKPEPSPYEVENGFPLAIYVVDCAELYLLKLPKNRKIIRIFAFE